MLNKLQWIKHKLAKTKSHYNLKYYVTSRDTSLQKNIQATSNSFFTHSTFKFSFSLPINDPIPTSTIDIKLDNDTHKRPLLEPRNNWFVNLTNIPIPKLVIGLLQLGENFCLPPDNDSKLTFELIKNLENNIKNFNNNKKIECRNRFVSILK